MIQNVCVKCGAHDWVFVEGVGALCRPCYTLYTATRPKPYIARKSYETDPDNPDAVSDGDD